MTKPSIPSPYHRHGFSPDVIAHAVWLYSRSLLSLRMVEDLLAQRRTIVLHQIICTWAEKFGRQFAGQIRKRSAGKLDEVVISIVGKKHWLWQAVDQDGFVLNVLVQSREAVDEETIESTRTPATGNDH